MDGSVKDFESKDGYITASFYAFKAIEKTKLEELKKELLSWSKIMAQDDLENSSDIERALDNFEYEDRIRSQIRKLTKAKPVDTRAITGRIYIDENGINAQVSLLGSKVRLLRALIERSEILRGTIPPFNFGLSHERAFKRFHVRIRPLVAAGTTLDLETLKNEPEYLTPQQWHEQLEEKQGEKVLIDMRNTYEFKVGKFKDAECPDVDTFREEMDYVREKYGDKKEKEIYMYCTGGIRCSVAGAILKSEGFSNVKTLKGGVIAYGKWLKNVSKEKSSESREIQSLFIGKNFTFDKRLGEPVTQDIVGRCDQCNEPCDTFTNCANMSCNILFIQCENCRKKHKGTCGSHFCMTQVDKPIDLLKKEKNKSVWSYHDRVRPEILFSKMKLGN
ncbi:UPF0176 protein [Zancudomyces culisetae]|uniref:UPF0176 protein n=1 Tax=Zancudomyces culisetae TaxID=1213189 RepID=A0A1R1PBK5_ZANCU|nr:UPF0176 protein [Zancudomyces culisetae]|eukprot:OMH78365.1 UPF0176 protein [Zancudomyces culisetae]